MIALLALFFALQGNADGICINPNAPCPISGDAMPALTQICPFCGPQFNWAQYPFMASYMPFQQTAPWWVLYGSLSYPNFYYPGAWVNNGIDGNYYPPGPGISPGDVYVAKPNLYLYAHKRTSFKAKVNPTQDVGWLLAMPPHDLKGWSGVIKSTGKIKHGKADYDYLFYDLRGQEFHFQDQKGFCVQAEELIPRLVIELNNAGFKKSSIEDFVGHWNYKIAVSDRYCVYPQTHQELDEHYPLTIIPTPPKITRLWFIVVPQEYLNDPRLTAKRFKLAPKLVWESPYLDAKGKKRQVASAHGIEAFEWAVGFLQGNTAPTTEKTSSQ